MTVGYKIHFCNKCASHTDTEDMSRRYEKSTNGHAFNEDAFAKNLFVGGGYIISSHAIY